MNHFFREKISHNFAILLYLVILFRNFIDNIDNPADYLGASLDQIFIPSQDSQDLGPGLGGGKIIAWVSTVLNSRFKIFYNLHTIVFREYDYFLFNKTIYNALFVDKIKMMFFYKNKYVDIS